MSPDHYPIKEHLAVSSEKISLGLEIPKGFDPGATLTPDVLLSLHPNWFVSNLDCGSDNFTADIKDYSTEETSLLTGRLQFELPEGEMIRIDISGTVDICIRFLNNNGVLHVQTHSPEQIDPADPVLLWIRSILQYIRLYVKKSIYNLFFRLVMNRMVLQMNPSQRKICMMIAKITLVEVLVIILILVGYTIFVL